MRWSLHWATKVAIVVIALAGLIRVPVVTEPFWNIDEAVSACAANTIVAGRVPYRDSIDHRGPVTYYVYALVFWLFGKNNMNAVHVALAFVVTGITALLYWICFRFVNRRVGLAAAFFFALLSFVAFKPHDMLAANTEWFQVAFTVTGVALLLTGLSNARRRLLFLSGVCFGLGYLSKQPALFDFAGAVGYLLIATVVGKESFRSLSRRLPWLLGGFLVINVAVLAYFAARSALPEFIFYFWTYNTKYYLPEVSIGERIAAYQRVAIPLLQNFAPYIVLFLGTAAQQSYTFVRRRAAPSTGHSFLLVCWALSSWIGTLLSGRDFGHYFIQAIPGVAVVCAVGLDNAVQWAQAFLRQRRAENRKLVPLTAGTWAFLGLLVLIAGLLLPLRQAVTRFAYLFDRNKPLLDLSVAPGRVQGEIVAAIHELAPPDSRIFVWGWYTELYVLGNRDPASRYTTANLVTGMIPWENIAPTTDTTYAIVPGSRETLMRDLRKRKPALVIDTSPGNFRCYGKYPLSSFPELSEFVQQRYRLVREVRDDTGSVAFRIFERRDLWSLANMQTSHLNYGEKVRFTKGGDANRFAALGWSRPENDCTWTEGEHASVAFRVNGTAQPMALKMKLAGFFKPPRLPFQVIHISVNGENVGNLQVSAQAVYAVRIPKSLLASDATLLVELWIPTATSPLSIGDNSDRRQLGICCAEMEISPDGGT